MMQEPCTHKRKPGVIVTFANEFLNHPSAKPLVSETLAEAIVGKMGRTYLSIRFAS